MQPTFPTADEVLKQVSFQELAEQLPAMPTIDEPASHTERTATTRSMSVGMPSRPVLGLPLARWIPQDCHSFMDYANGLVMASLARTGDATARVASLALAGSVLGVSAITDCRVSIAKLVPIEAHEVIDHVWAASAIAAPFVLGYWKTAPKVAIAHVAAGVLACIGSLLTDYRAYSKRSQTAAR